MRPKREELITEDSDSKEIAHLLSMIIGHVMRDKPPEQGEPVSMQEVMDRIDTLIEDARALRQQNATLKDIFIVMHIVMERLQRQVCDLQQRMREQEGSQL